MNILFVCHRFPYPPSRGGKIRPFHIISHLHKNHRVTVASLARSPQEAREGQGIAPHCTHFEVAEVRAPIQMARMVARLPTATPSSMGYFYSADLARKIRRLLAREQFDLIFVHCSSVAQYVSQVKGAVKVLDFGDMDSQKWLEYVPYKPFPLSAGYWWEGRKLEREERRLAKLFDLCTVTTKAERETLAGFRTGVPDEWFPNGVDHLYFSPATEPYDVNTISFVGRMDYYPNEECMVDFCTNVLPLIQARKPDLKLLIVGADPSSAVKKLAERRGVTVTGSVRDVRPFVRGSALMVAPLNIARGTQNKILESMSMGVPVVTSRTAAGGVDATADEHFLVAATPAEQAAAILRILEDPAERRRLAMAGRERMLSHHSWPASMTRLDGILAGCMDRLNRAPSLVEN